MRVAYVIYNERPFSGLIKTQVVTLLKEIKRQKPELGLTLVSFLPPWVAANHGQSLGNVRQELASAEVELEVHPWVFPYRPFLYNATLFPFLRWWAIRLFSRVLAGKYQLVHCRGYFPSVIALQLREALAYRCIFDMRSLFPEENVTADTWSREDKAYRMWKRLERWAIAKADATVGVSEPMVEHIRAVVPGANTVLIPCCVDTRTFRFEPHARREIRQAKGWDGRLIVAYEGNLGKWNDISMYARYFSLILESRPDAHFLILTPSRDVDYVGVMQEYGIDGSQFTVREASPPELPRWLSAADVGLQVMAKVEDGHTRLGVKFVEYLSCGLPVMVNSNVGAAARIVKAHGVGTVIDLDDSSRRARVQQFLHVLPSLGVDCISLAGELFSVQACAHKYIELYHGLP